MLKGGIDSYIAYRLQVGFVNCSIFRFVYILIKLLYIIEIHTLFGEFVYIYMACGIYLYQCYIYDCLIT